MFLQHTEELPNGESVRTRKEVSIDDGMVELVTGYHKGYRNSGKEKIIHSFPPEKVGKLLVYYLWLVEPFARMLRWVRNGDWKAESMESGLRIWFGPA
jgi:hypothetical protein